MDESSRPNDPPPPPPTVLDYASPTTGDEHGNWCGRRGGRLVTSVHCQLPEFCVKCGAPAVHSRWQDFYWAPWWILLCMVGMTPGLILMIVLYFVFRRTASVMYGLCDRHRRRQRIGRWVSVGLLLAGLAVIGINFYGITRSRSVARQFEDYQAWILVSAVLLFSAGLFVGRQFVRVLRVGRITRQEAEFSGACHSLLDRLPPVQF